MARTIAKDHDEKRRLILKAAAKVFARDGVARASMNEVAKTGGISKANIYHYYASKSALLFDILEAYLCSLRDRILQVPQSDLDDATKLMCVLEEYLLAYEGMDHEHKIQIEGLPLLTEDQQEILKGYQRDMVAMVSDVLRTIVAEHIANDKRALHSVTMSIFGMLNWYYVWQPKADAASCKDYAKTITHLIIFGASKQFQN